MSVTVAIHKTHRHLTDGLASVETRGSTVKECLQDLIRQFPPMNEALFDGKGGLRRNIEVFINAVSAYPNEMSRPVSDGDEIHLTVMLAGG